MKWVTFARIYCSPGRERECERRVGYTIGKCINRPYNTEGFWKTKRLDIYLKYIHLSYVQLDLCFYRWQVIYLRGGYMFIHFFSLLKKRGVVPFIALLLLSGYGQPFSSAQNQQNTLALTPVPTKTSFPSPTPIPTKNPSSALTPVPTKSSSALTPVPTKSSSALTPFPTKISSPAPTPIPTKSSSALTPVPTKISSPAPTSIPSASESTPLGKSVAFDLDGWLHVQSETGFTCDFSTNGSLSVPGTLVLPMAQPTYDQGAIQSMKNYLTAFSQVTSGQLGTVPHPAPSVNPSIFQLVPVNIAKLGCNEILQVTNIGNTPVQISQISVQFTADTQVNNHHYNLIDACSLIPSIYCLGSPMGSYEPVYEARFDLHPGKANTIMPATCLGYSTAECLQQALMLHPGEAAEIYLTYFSNTSDNLSFSLMPSFTLEWSGKQVAYPAPQLQEYFSFANISQFSCYTLKGQKFTEVSLGNDQYYCM
jgi:hypothetical protein